jgi:hypothetical protein
MSWRSRQKLIDLASKIRSKKEKHDQKSRKHTRTTFTPPTLEKTFLLKRKKGTKETTKNTKTPKPKQWLGEGQPSLEPSQGEKQISTRSNKGDKTKQIGRRLLEASLPRKNKAHKWFFLKGFLSMGTRAYYALHIKGERVLEY